MAVADSAQSWTRCRSGLCSSDEETCCTTKVFSVCVRTTRTRVVLIAMSFSSPVIGCSLLELWDVVRERWRVLGWRIRWCQPRANNDGAFRGVREMACVPANQRIDFNPLICDRDETLYRLRRDGWRMCRSLTRSLVSGESQDGDGGGTLF